MWDLSQGEWQVVGWAGVERESDPVGFHPGKRDLSEDHQWAS